MFWLCEVVVVVVEYGLVDGLDTQPGARSPGHSSGVPARAPG